MVHNFGHLSLCACDSLAKSLSVSSFLNFVGKKYEAIIQSIIGYKLDNVGNS